MSSQAGIFAPSSSSTSTPAGGFNVTFDDTSPLFRTTGSSWKTDHRDDPQINKYFGGTFLSATSDGDSVSFKFNGTDVWAYGAQRFNHGIYNVSLDGTTQTFSGESPTELFQRLLFDAHGLDGNSEHTLIFANANALNPSNKSKNVWFDLDYVTVTQPVVGDNIVTRTFDDTDPAFTYTGSWKTGFAALNQYQNSTGHVTEVYNDAVTFDFTGSSVAIYGGVASNHGNYVTMLDGVGQGSFNGSYFDLRSRAVLFAASGLVDGPHRIQLYNAGSGSSNTFGIDYAVVNGSAGPTGSTSTAQASTATTSSLSTTTPAASSTPTTTLSSMQSGASSGTSDSTSVATAEANAAGSSRSGPSIVAVILGCVISALFCLAVIILGFWLLRSRRRRRADRQSESDRRQFIDLVSDGSDVSEPKLGTSVAPPATPTLLRMPPPAPASYTPSYYAYSTTSRPPAYPLSIHPPSTAGLADAGHSPDRLPYVETESNRTFNDDHRRQMMERRISGHPFAMAPNEMERMMRKDRDIKRHWI